MVRSRRTTSSISTGPCARLRHRRAYFVSSVRPNRDEIKGDVSSCSASVVHAADLSARGVFGSVQRGLLQARNIVVRAFPN
jgi:hypothetical protein